MTTLSLQVNASGNDAHAGSINDGSGRAVTSGATFLLANTDLTSSIVSPGSHGGNDEYSAIFRFLNVTIAQGTVITSATFTITAQATYNAGANVVKYHVSAEDVDNAPIPEYGNPGRTLRASSPPVGATARPRTTAESANWTLTSVTVDTEYSIDVTAPVQEVIDRPGFASGNALSIIMDTHTDCTSGEWQDFHGYDGSPTKAAKLVVVYGSAGKAFPIRRNVWRRVRR